MSSPRVSSPARDSYSASPVIKPTNRFTFGAMADSSSSSDDDEILRPRGRLAARLLQQKANEEGSGSDTEMGNKSPAEDDDVIPTKSRKLLQRKQRSVTPEATAQSTENSPRLFVTPSKSFTSSPGLFVTPSKPRSPTAGSNANTASESEDDEDLPSVTNLSKNAKFLALVEKKRKEREAREAEEARKKAEKAERLAAQAAEDNMSMGDDEDDNITDDEGGRRLTQRGARPSRKASKKAMEDMSRETQRLARSMQLAHEAKVKKKITKSALFERFNFRTEGALELPKTISSRPTTPGSGPHTDAEVKDADTPPSSPPHSAKKDVSAAAPTAIELQEDADGELPTLGTALKAADAQKKVDKGKGKATAADLEAKDRAAQKSTQTKRNIRVRFPELQANIVTLGDGDDDDLVVEPSRKNKLDVIFDRVPVNKAKESRPMHVLRKLAHLDDPDKKAGAAPAAKNRFQKQQPPAMTAGELQATLLGRARAQAKLERDHHLEMLRAKGIHIQTAEEREKEEQAVDDMVARARKEAEEIMAREREAAKKDRKARREAGEDDPLGWDDSDDDSYDGTEGDKEEAEVELSGSEEEEADDEYVDADEPEEADPAAGLFDEAAESADESVDGDAEEQSSGEESDEDALPSSKKVVGRRTRKPVAILSDDDDEEEVSKRIVEATPKPKASLFRSPAAPNTNSPKIPTSVLRSATKTFIPGLPVAAGRPAGLGLTQIFAGTMDDSQAASSAPTESQSQPRPTFDVEDFPESNFSQTAREVGEDMVLDSQPGAETQGPETQGVQFNFSQSQVHGFDSLLRDTREPSQMSELIEPTQDEGYHNYSPLLHRFVEVPTPTAETIKLQGTEGDGDHAESPLVRRTGKLRCRADLAASASASDGEGQDEASDEADEFGFGTKASAFNVMKKAAIKEKKRKAGEAFNKKKSKAREMVEEQAEESEDEYAGLGGVDGEVSDDDDDAGSVQEMIDDETKHNETDERKLAAFYADRERVSDEKQVEKLFHDITTGQLRRKRGGDWDDLSDSDDGGEAKRRLKRRQFAKMQRALFADERISKVAENPRNQAFLRTIEDNGSDDDMDFIFAPPPQTAEVDSQESQSASEREATTIPDSQPQATRPADEQPPAHLRRTKDGKKPSNLGEIRESLSNLLDEPLNSSSVIPVTELGSDSEDEAPTRDHTRPTSSHSTSSANGSTSSNKENRNPRRGRVAVVDRITLKRNSSLSTSSTSRLAFAASNTTPAGFKVPALLRRATTNSLMSSSSSASSTGVTTHNGISGGNSFASEKIKKPAGKRSGVNYFARENERRAAVAEMERRREARKVKGAEGRSKAVGGLFGAGKFE